MLGLALYVAGSLGCALSSSISMLIAFRAVQAFGGAVGIVVARAVVRDLHAGAAAARMLSRLVLVMGVAPILAPLFGGLMLQVFGWRAIFGVLAAIGAVTLVGGRRRAARDRAAARALAAPDTSDRRRAPRARLPRLRTDRRVLAGGDVRLHLGRVVRVHHAARHSRADDSAGSSARTPRGWCCHRR